MIRAITIAILLAGCGDGGSKDVCDQLADKSQRFGKVTGFDRDKALRDCKKHNDHVRADPQAACILDAEDAAAMKKCAIADEEPTAAREDAEKRADEAVKMAREAQDKLTAIEGDMAELSKKLDDAVASLQSAQNGADRAAANAKLKELQREKAEMERRIADAKAAAARAERTKGVHISKECMDNPLAKGCH
jgi:hypothetical protein